MFGAEVVTAPNGAKALETLATDEAFDVLFTDLRMPVMGGDELITTVGVRLPDLFAHSLLTTGDVAAPAADAAIRATGRPCLPKPFNIRELVTAIRMVIDAPDS